MTLVVKSDSYVRDQIAVANMLRDRKRVFVDLLKWKLAVVDDEYEIDQFDHAGAVYLICSDADGNHRGSLRLLPTTAPHILGSLFPDLCDGPVPTGPNVYELTRGCFSPRISS
jgi:N-acyl-L-homoserine lactone synthetase